MEVILPRHRARKRGVENALGQTVGSQLSSPSSSSFSLLLIDIRAEKSGHSEIREKSTRKKKQVSMPQS